MTVLRVPFGLKEPLSSNQRPGWLNEFVEHLGDFALKDITFTGGTGAVEWSGSGDVSEYVAFVVIDDPEAAGASPTVDGSPGTPEAAAELVVARALLDKGLTAATSWVHRDYIERLS